MEAVTAERERCEFIRWKGMFIDVQRDPSAAVYEEPHICWCMHTQNPLGPDGEVVDEDTCNWFRSCYQKL